MLWRTGLFFLVILTGVQSVLSNFSMDAAKFLYFGYGSNLLSRRIHINNPTAIRKGAAKLPGYRLDFNGYAKRWGGAVATIVPDERRHVWGALWEINLSDMGQLDRQEGVASGIYEPLTVNVETSNDGTPMVARTYQYIQLPPPPMPANISADLASIWRDLPEDRRPSPEYRRVIIMGALETGLPQSYIDALEEIPHNGFDGSSGLNVIPHEEFITTTAPTNSH